MTTNEASMKKHVEEAVFKTLEKYGSRFLENGFHGHYVRKAVNESAFVSDVKFELHGMEIRFYDCLYNLIVGDCSKEIYKDFESRIEKLGWESEERNYATVYYAPIPLTA